MDFKTAKRILKGIHYGQKRNQLSSRPVKNIEINIEDIIRLYEHQGGRCYWSGLILNPDFNYIKFHPFAISVDRLDNNTGYVFDNIVLCRRMFNLGKIAFNSDDFKDVMESLEHEYKTLRP
jgi:hypothetical protein